MKKKLFTMLIAASVLVSATGFGYASECRQTQETVSIKQTLKADCSKLIEKFCGNLGNAGNIGNIGNSGNIGGNSDDNNSASEIVQKGSMAGQVVNLVNKERKANGLSALSSDSQLAKLAQLKAEDMAKNGYFSHTSPTYGSAFDMMKTYGVSYKTAGENIAKGQKTAASVMDGWMNSSGHRANILKSDYTKIGVGYAKSPDGTTYWVQIFKG